MTKLEQMRQLMESVKGDKKAFIEGAMKLGLTKASANTYYINLYCGPTKHNPALVGRSNGGV